MFDADALAARTMMGGTQPESISFDYFYPLNFGPLAVTSGVGDFDLEKSGLRMLVRPDIQELSQIRGKFVLAS